MNNTLENQTMNRNVLVAFNVLQDCGISAVPMDDIIEQVVPMMDCNDDFVTFEDNMLGSLALLKKVGLVSESRNAEFKLCSCPTKAQMKKILNSTSRTTKMKATKSKTAAQKKRSKAVARVLRDTNVSNNAVDTSLMTFLTGRDTSSLVQSPVCNAAQHQFEPMETDDDITFNNPDQGAGPVMSRFWEFGSPLPI